MKMYKVKSFSGGKDHEVVCLDGINWVCDCMGFARKPWKNCNHILKARGKWTTYDIKKILKHNKLMARFRSLKIKLASCKGEKTREKIQERMQKIKEIVLKIREEVGDEKHSSST